MIAKRIIPCLDVKDGMVVKGKNFVNLVEAGSVVGLASKYASEGADELVFLDITASVEKRKTLLKLVEETAAVVRIPFTVGGGISELGDIENLLKMGADKISLNTAIFYSPDLITQAANRFGSQAVVAAIDVNIVSGKYFVFIKGGRENTWLDSIEWCKRCADLGAGEILLTSMNKDGTKTGYDIQFLKLLKEKVNVPVIASGGAGKPEDFLEAFDKANVDACLAAGLFHFNQLSIPELKEYLFLNKINVRTSI